MVEKGQTLITLDDSGITKDLKRTASKQRTLEMQAERLRAFVENREPDFSRFSDIKDSVLLDQKNFFAGMRVAREKEAGIIHDQITQKKQSVSALRSELETQRKNLAIANDIYQRRNTLNQKGYASDMILLEDQKRVNDLKGEMSRLKNQIAVAGTEIAEFQSRLESLSARHTDEVHEKLDQVLAEKAQNIEIIRKLEERIARLEIKAPARGLVKGLNVNTIGAVIQPGQTILEIVPLGKDLEVQVKISPQDIGHLKIGQPVQVKFSTFDFSRYGSVKGTLDHISATTFAANDGGRYYQGRILLTQNHVGGRSG